MAAQRRESWLSFRALWEGFELGFPVAWVDFVVGGGWVTTASCWIRSEPRLPKSEIQVDWIPTKASHEPSRANLRPAFRLFTSRPSDRTVSHPPPTCYAMSRLRVAGSSPA
ncbi:hypothetical protein GW17_00061099 [Ensete ventricosum]|nr:hypothetical protein GW17_00061099 [Ensete ventricosum]